MKSPGLDVLYGQLEKHILLVQSYTEISDLVFIIKSCRLKPYDFIFKDKTEKLILYKHWFDEFNNSFTLVNKKIKLTYNDLSLPRKNITSTDLYHGFSLEKVAKISKLAYICFGKDDELQQDCGIVTFLGIDNYLRSFMYLYGEWQQVSPLLLGIRNLRMISQNKDIKYFKKFDAADETIIPCANSEQWLTFMPPRKEFLSLLSVHCQPMHLIFNPKEQ